MTYSFTGKNKTWLTAGMVIGLLCMVLTWFGDDDLHTRFWSNFLHNSVFFTGIALMAGFFMTASITAWAGWYVVFKRVWESISLFLVVGIPLMLIIGIGVYLHWNHLYHWSDQSILDPNDPEKFDPILYGKSSFLNTTWYIGGTLVLGLIWIFLLNKIRSLSLAEDAEGSEGFKKHYGVRKYAAIFLPFAGFGSAAMVWQWIMSVDAHWYSTLFAWYCGASWFVSMICLTILLLMYLKSKGYYQNVTTEHLHDLGKFLFAFSIFWTYLWFSQYMLIWYANVGEETIYFKERVTNYPALFYMNLIINFVAPFFILMRNDTKRKFGSLGFTAGLVLFGHWLDFFLMLKPGILHTAHAVAGHGAHSDGADHSHGTHAADGAAHGAESAAHGGGEMAAHASTFEMGFSMPGFLELGTFIGFLCLFIFFVLHMLSKAPLVGANDPYLEESIHHHT
ncbi:MAG: hypothetical protein HKN51_02790 [Saprospiraceae bacterium]|nr:hypothetical protein [Bacteroidia bacterium]NNE13875.1 hypothetical protein [Saprospiraceae bacterium]